MSQQPKINVDAILVTMSNDIAKLSREKAVIQAQLYEYQQIASRLDQELKEVKKELETLKNTDKEKQAKKK